MADVTVVWDEAAVKADIANPSSAVGQGMARIAAGVVVHMKALCPVAPVSRPPSRRWPARKSGTLRSSIRAFRQGDGGYLIGPTDRTGRLGDGPLLGPMVEGGTVPHIIASHGPWSLHNNITGDYFGRVVHHPGTRPHPFIRPAAEALNGQRFHFD